MGYCSQKKKKNTKTGKVQAAAPDYLNKFLHWACSNLDTYASRLAAGEAADWRTKESLMFAFGTIRDNIWKQKELK